MKITAQKAPGASTLTVSLTPESSVDDDFMKVLMMMVVDGGKMRVDNEYDERAVLRWHGILGASINRGESDG